MRADRLLSILIVLQGQGQVSAPDLAAELEVSVRTIYRDVEALSMAGVPIYATTGRNGGIALDEDYRMTLSGLSKADLHALMVMDTSTPLQQLGLGNVQGQTVLKLLGMLSRTQKQEATFVRQRLFIDPTGWYGDDDTPHLGTLQQAIWHDTTINMTYTNWEGVTTQQSIAPYGLVFKAGMWYLIGAKNNGDMRIYRVNRVQAVGLSRDTFHRDLNFDIHSYWQQTSQNFLHNVAVYQTTLQVIPPIYRLIETLFQHRYDVIKESAHHITLNLRFADFYEARTMVLGFGDGATVLQPTTLREAIIEQATVILKHYTAQ